MTISLGNALKSVKEDEKWIKKLIIGGFVTILVAAASVIMERESLSLGIRLVGLALYIIIGGFLSGFLVSSANKQINENVNTLTEWSEPNILLKGIKFIFSWLLYSVVLTLLFVIIGTIFTIIVCFVLGIIYYLLNLVLPIWQTLGNIIFGVVLASLFVIMMLYVMQYFNAGIVCYYKNSRFHDLMALKKQFKIIKENQHASWTLIGKTILYGLLFALIFVVFCITIVGIIAVPFICFAAYVVCINLYTQYAREIEIGRYLD